MAALQPLASASGGREGGDMASESGPRVLLGNLGPIMRLGMNPVLSEQGCRVVGQEDRPSAIIGAAHRLRPDIVVLDLDNGSPHERAHPPRGAPPPTPPPPGGAPPGGGPPPEPPVVLGAGEKALREALEPVWNTSRLVAVPIVE